MTAKRPVKETYLKICPRCGGTNISGFTGRYVGEAEDFTQNCRDCGYEGLVPEIPEKQLESFRKTLIRK